MQLEIALNEARYLKRPWSRFLLRGNPFQQLCDLDSQAMSKRPEFRRSLLLSSHSSIPCWTAATLFLHSARRISFGNRNSYGHSHQQIWFCGRCHRLGHPPSALGAAVILHPSSSLAPYTSQTADVIFCRREEIISCCLLFPTNTSQLLNHNHF